MYHLKQVPSEAQIKKYLRRIVFGKNLFCPACRSRDVLTHEDRYRCQKCRIKFSLLSHTWLADLKLSYEHLWLILWCWTTGVPVRQAASLTECSDEAVYRWYERFREHVPDNSLILEKIVQLDEAYFKCWALFLGKQTGSRKLAYEFVPGRSVERHHATFFLQQHVRPRSRLWTDGASIYENH